MTLEENKAIVLKLLEAVNKQDLSLLDDFLAPDYGNKTLKLKGREDLKKLLRVQYEGFPDVHRTIEDIIAEGDQVWVHVKITGTHTGNYRGLAPTGKKIVVVAVPTYRVVDGKIVEGWSVWDALDMFKVLGVVEYKGFPDDSQENLASNAYSEK
jgi:predicted ester cyclase